MDFMKAISISIFIAGVLAGRMIDLFMLVAPFGQTIVDIIFIRLDLAAGCHVACYDGLDRHLPHIG